MTTETKQTLLDHLDEVKKSEERAAKLEIELRKARNEIDILTARLRRSEDYTMVLAARIDEANEANEEQQNQ